jgi:hypothetical protein
MTGPSDQKARENFHERNSRGQCIPSKTSPAPSHGRLAYPSASRTAIFIGQVDACHDPVALRGPERFQVGQHQLGAAEHPKFACCRYVTPGQVDEPFTAPALNSGTPKVHVIRVWHPRPARSGGPDGAAICGQVDNGQVDFPHRFREITRNQVGRVRPDLYAYLDVRQDNTAVLKRSSRRIVALDPKPHGCRLAPRSDREELMRKHLTCACDPPASGRLTILRT